MKTIFNHSAIELNTIYIYKDNKILVAIKSKYDTYINKIRLDKSTYKEETGITDIYVNNLVKKIKVNLTKKDNFIIKNKEESCKYYDMYDLYIYCDDNSIKILKLDDTKKEIEEGYSHLYSNYKIELLNDNITVYFNSYDIVFFEKDVNFSTMPDYIFNNIKEIKKTISETTSETIKQELIKKAKQYKYYSYAYNKREFKEFYVKEFIKVETTQDYNNFQSFKKEFEEKMHINSYMSADEFKKFLEFYGIDYNKSFMGK